MQAPLTKTARRRAETAAARWSALLLSDPRAKMLEENAEQVRALSRAAFVLYALEWGADFNIAEWQWPFTQLAEETERRWDRVGRAFDGMEPWAVLFHRAVTFALA